MRPPKQAISPSVVRTLNKPSASSENHGDIDKPPSPTPFSNSVHAYATVSPFRKWIEFTPSVEKRHVCRFANPAQNGATVFWSSIWIEAGNEFVVLRTETGQSLNTRRCSTALFGSGVANAAEASTRHAAARTEARVVIRLMSDVSKDERWAGSPLAAGHRSQRRRGLRRDGRGSERGALAGARALASRDGWTMRKSRRFTKRRGWHWARTFVAV